MTTAFGNSAFSGVAARQWNMLHTELFKSTSSYTFTRQAKKWLLLNQCCSHMWPDVCMCVYISVCSKPKVCIWKVWTFPFVHFYFLSL